jgi:predicted  nucleic acid-binding Zn-ribbon protein
MYIRKDVHKAVKLEPSPEQVIMESKPSPYLPQKTPAVPEVKKEPEPVKDKLEWLGKDFVKLASKEEPIFLSIETIKILEEGKYQIDVTSLMGGKPVIVQDENGVYYIDVPYAMKKKGEHE